MTKSLLVWSPFKKDQTLRLLMGHKVYDHTDHTIKFWRVCRKERNNLSKIEREISRMLIRSHNHLSAEFFITIFAFLKGI